MYSLYRAWLMRDAVAAASLASPPDVVINVGSMDPESQGEPRNYSYQFVAHKHLVSIHSGYLKSLIQNESSLNSSSPNSLMAISVPSITPDTFAPLLSFMYTGYLDLTNENIYSVLLATHLLHMPRALDLCRAYLVQNQPEFQGNAEYRPNVFPFQNNPNIIKPIPSRKIHNFPHPFWPPVNVPPLLLHTSPNGPFQCVPPSEKLETATEPQKFQEPKSPPAIPSTSKIEDPPSPPSSVSPCLSTASFTSDERTVHIIKSPQRKPHKKKDNLNKDVNNKNKVNNENLKAVLDVACCDGPVRFHRVLNENYGLSLDEIIDDPEVDKIESPEKISDKEYLENYPKTQFLKMKNTKKFSNFMHQQMLNSNLYNNGSKKSKSTKGVIQLRKIIEKEIDQMKPRDENETENETEDENPDRIYTCVYCKHTFKSQYCYQKHARRHINPVEDATAGAAAAAAAGGNNKNMVIVRKVVSTTKVDGKEGGSNVRREVRLLDMNVQYYPCKTCGSKFPSYYFVHKHRKLCHSNEENLDENSNQAVENSDSSSQTTPQTKT